VAGPRSTTSGPLVVRRKLPSTATTFQLTMLGTMRRPGRAARRTSGFRTPFWSDTTSASGPSTAASSAAAAAVWWLFTQHSTTSQSASALASVANRYPTAVTRGPSKSWTASPVARSWSRSRARPTKTTSAAPAACSRPPT